MGLLKKFGAFLINFTIFFLIVTFSPGLPPKTTFPFEEFSVVKPHPLVGSLEPNNWLENPEKLFVGKLDGPESLLARDGVIYTSQNNGHVVKIVDGKVQSLAKFGKLCYDDDPKYICGRPLGLAFDTINPDGIIVMDTSNGIFELNIKSGKKKQLVSEKDVIGSSVPRPAKLFNSVVVAKNGDLYFTDSSSDFGIENVAMTFFVNPSGRLIHYARKTGQMTVLLDNLWFANGVVISPDEEFLVVADLLSTKLVKYWLKSGKVGETQTFAEGLPGIPDNLSSDQDGIWVALPLTADPQNPLLPQSMARVPLIRKFVSRILSLLELLAETINKVYPNKITKRIAHEIGSTESAKHLSPPRSTILRIDWSGKIIAAYHAFDSSIYTHVMELDGDLYLGSIIHNYIAKVPRKSHL